MTRLLIYLIQRSEIGSSEQSDALGVWREYTQRPSSRVDL